MPSCSSASLDACGSAKPDANANAAADSTLASEAQPPPLPKKTLPKKSDASKNRTPLAGAADEKIIRRWFEPARTFPAHPPRTMRRGWGQREPRKRSVADT